MAIPQKLHRGLQVCWNILSLSLSMKLRGGLRGLLHCGELDIFGFWGGGSSTCSPSLGKWLLYILMESPKLSSPPLFVMLLERHLGAFFMLLWLTLSQRERRATLRENRTFMKRTEALSRESTGRPWDTVLPWSDCCVIGNIQCWFVWRTTGLVIT